MTAQRDYILRMIEQMGAVLKALLGKILDRTAEPGEVHAALSRGMQQIGFDLEVALIADAATLERMIAPSGELDPARGWLVAETMFLHGLEADLDDRPDEARLSLEKALRLYRLFDPRSPIPVGFPEAADRIREIETRLNGAKAG